MVRLQNLFSGTILYQTNGLALNTVLITYTHLTAQNLNIHSPSLCVHIFICAQTGLYAKIKINQFKYRVPL